VLASVRVQKQYRGRPTRKSAEQLSDRVRQQKAAASMQALYRGRSERKSIEAFRSSDVVVTSSANIKLDKKQESVRKINDYTMGKLLGSGAYGSVYKATHSSDQYAIKVLKRSLVKRGFARPPPSAAPALGAKSNADSDTIMREISVMKRLAHPNVVRLFEVIDDPGQNTLYLVMDLVEGGTLAAPIASKRRVPEPELRAWLRDTFLGLEHLHLNGVYHRDIKPENILWDKREQRAKLADFGVSALVGERLTLGSDYAHATSGTPPFWSPEMCEKVQGGYSMSAADWWAVGVCLFMWLYHRPPYEAPTVHMLLERIKDEELVFPGDTFSSWQLLELLRRLLDRHPGRRYKLRDLRKDAFITDDGASPVPACRVDESQVSVAVYELQTAITTVKHNLRLSASVRGKSAAVLPPVGAPPASCAASDGRVSQEGTRGSGEGSMGEEQQAASTGEEQQAANAVGDAAPLGDAAADADTDAEAADADAAATDAAAAAAAAAADAAATAADAAS